MSRNYNWARALLEKRIALLAPDYEKTGAILLDLGDSHTGIVSPKSRYITVYEDGEPVAKGTFTRNGRWVRRRFRKEMWAVSSFTPGLLFPSRARSE